MPGYLRQRLLSLSSVNRLRLLKDAFSLISLENKALIMKSFSVKSITTKIAMRQMSAWEPRFHQINLSSLKPAAHKRDRRRHFPF